MIMTTDTTDTVVLTDAQIDRLTADFALGDEDLDDLVHDLFSGRASAVNNGGTAAQLAFLAAECKDEAGLRAWLAGSFPGREPDSTPSSR
ncbi:hypothetical protein ACPC54_18790 [Kitasatospora sp. NPDC094028]